MMIRTQPVIESRMVVKRKDGCDGTAAFPALPAACIPVTVVFCASREPSLTYSATFISVDVSTEFATEVIS